MIDQVVGTRDDGTPVTAADRIVEILAIGGYFEEAAAAAGVHRETAYGWLRIGAQVHARLARNPTAKVTAHEARCQAFSDAKHRAEAEWEARTLAELERLGRGGRLLTTTTEKTEVDEHGVERLVERVKRTEQLAPNARVLMWRLERRYPDRYAHRLEVTGAGGEPLLSAEERAESIAASAVEYLDNVVAIGTKKKPARKRKAPAKKAAASG